MKINTEVAYLLKVADYFTINIYVRNTKRKVTEYGLFDSMNDAISFAKEHHITISN